MLNHTTTATIEMRDTTANLPTIEEIVEGAQKYVRKIHINHDQLEDMAQEFCLGAVEALGKVDTERAGARTFVWTYAAGFVRHAIDRHNRKEGGITFVRDIGVDDNGDSLFNSIADKKAESPAQSTFNTDLALAVDSLTDSLKRTIVGRFVDDLGLQEIADKEGVTKERIRQREVEALEILKNRV